MNDDLVAGLGGDLGQDGCEVTSDHARRADQRKLMRTPIPKPNPSVTFLEDKDYERGFNEFPVYAHEPVTPPLKTSMVSPFPATGGSPEVFETAVEVYDPSGTRKTGLLSWLGGLIFCVVPPFGVVFSPASIYWGINYFLDKEARSKDHELTPSLPRAIILILFGILGTCANWWLLYWLITK